MSRQNAAKPNSITYVLILLLLASLCLFLTGCGEAEAFVKDLADNDPAVAENAKSKLVEMGSPAVKPLLVSLQDSFYAQGEHDKFRRSAMEILVKTGKPAVEPLIAALEEYPIRYNQCVAEVLGEIGDARAVEPLITEFIENPSYSEYRNILAKALGKFRDVRTIEPLIPFLGSQDSSKPASEALVQIGSPAVEPLIAAMNNEENDTDEISLILGRIGDLRAIDPLMSALENEDSWRGAADALVSIGYTLLGNDDARAVKLLIAVFIKRGGSEYLNPSAEDGLLRIGSPAVEPLIAALGSSDVSIRNDIVVLLGKIGDKRAVEPLITVLKDADAYTRQCAANALGNIGDARAIEPLIAALNQEDWMDRTPVREALVKFGKAAVKPLIAALKNDNDTIRMEAASILGSIGDADALEPLIAIYTDRNDMVRWSAEDSIIRIGEPAASILISFLTDADSGKRREAAAILGKMNSPLLDTLDSALAEEKLDIVASAYLYYIVKGKDGTEDVLIKALNACGSVAMAEDYLNCGNSKLDEAARKWAGSHGYRVYQSSGGNGNYHGWGTGKN